MPDPAAIVDGRLKREIGEWIVSATLAGTLEVGIVTGVGERFNAAGVSMARISVATDLLDPTFDGRGVRWLRDEGGVEETFVRNEEGTIVTEDFPQSPFGFLLRSGKPTLRRHLDGNVSAGRVRDARPVSGPGRHRLPGRLRARRRIHSAGRIGRHRGVVDDGRAGWLYRRAGRVAHGPHAGAHAVVHAADDASRHAHAADDVSRQTRGGSRARRQYRARPGRADPGGRVVQRPRRASRGSPTTSAPSICWLC